MAHELTKDGSKSDLAHFLRTRSDADTVAARIEKAWGGDGIPYSGM
jgi:hypothetical protein